MENRELSNNNLFWYVLIAKGNEQKAISDVMFDNSLRGSSEYKFEIFTTLYGATGQNTRRARHSNYLIPSYVFIRGTEQDIIKLKTNHPYLKFPRIAYENGVLTHVPRISNAQMMSLRIAVESAGEDVAYFKPGEIDLECGDRVRIISGPLTGVEGVLINSQGKSGGAVHIEVHNLFVARTVSVSAEDMEILSFSDKANTRLYDNLDRFYTMARKCIRNYASSTITDEDKCDIKVMIKRLQHLELKSKNTRSKLTVMLLLGYKVLGMTNHFQKQLEECRELASGLASELQKTFSLVYIYACTGDRNIYEDCCRMLESWGDVTIGKSKMKYELKEDFAFFRHIYNMD